MAKTKAKWIHLDSKYFDTGSTSNVSLDSSSVLLLTSSNAETAISASHALFADVLLGSIETANTASYVDFPNVDNVPDFVLESETASMLVSNVLISQSGQDADLGNITTNNISTVTGDLDITAPNVVISTASLDTAQEQCLSWSLADKK